MIASGTNLPIVDTVCIAPEVLEPKVFNIAINNIVAIAKGINNPELKPSN